MREPIVEKTRRDTSSMEGGLYMNSSRNNKKGKRGFKKLLTGVIAAALAVVLWVTMIPQDALAATADANTAGADYYKASLGDEYSTEYAGRVWSDKSVDTKAQTYNGTTVSLDAESGEEFLVTFSALSTSQSITGSVSAPVDVVFVIDTSNSMSTSMGSSQGNRFYNAVKALNTAVEEILALNPNNRVGVVAYNSTSYELLPLDSYTAYTGNNSKNAYFSCDSSNSTTVTIQAKNSAGQNINTTHSASSGTNVQKGIASGMNMLATEKSTTVTVNGQTVTRIPAVVILSDGQPTNASSYSQWWNINSDTAKMTPASSLKSVFGLKALMNASYMKQAIDVNYKLVGKTNKTSVYTIGVGITSLSSDYRNLANITLNPKDYLNADNSRSKAIREAWETYATGSSVTLDSTTLIHPNGNLINNVSDITDIIYNDAYYSVDSASAMVDVFEKIVASIAISTPEVPTEIKTDDPLTDGYITYTDPIGEYMEVKNIKALVYNNTTFEWVDTRDEKTTSGNVTTYTFKPTDTVNTGVYNDQSVSNIIIQVTQTDETNQTMVIKVPAALVPVRVNTVTLNADGSVATHTHNGMNPVRVIYSVGLQSGILENGVVDTSLLSDEYLKDNINSDGTVNFYSNLYSGKEIEHLRAEDGTLNTTTVGDTTVEFEPSHTNPFYYISGDVPIYKDSEGTQRLTAAEGIDPDATYYYITNYYHGTSVEKEVVARTGNQLLLTDIVTVDGYLCRAAGSPRLNRILEFEGTKAQNATNTADDFYLPTFVGSTTGDDAYDGKYVIYLGNNGVVNYAASGTLAISKNVVIPDGLSGPDDQTFTFTINFNGDATLSGIFDYDIVDAAGDVVTTGTITDGGTLTLADDQTALIYNLPHNTTYTVKEAEVEGFTTTSSVTDEGELEATIEAGKTETIAFTNTYSATPVTVTSDMGLQGAKVLTGKDWSDTDSFRFILESRRLDTPMPAAVSGVSELRVIENSHRALIVTVAEPTAAKDQVVDFGFGSITYDKEGTYEYVISELVESDKIHGVSYSAAMYTVVVKVTDNGEGELEATLTMTKVLDDAGTVVNQIVGILGSAEGPMATFTNVFDADNETWIPAGTKVYTDTSGANPITTGMFQFEIEAVTAGAPMPANTVVGNVDSQIGYETITFTQYHAGEDEAHAKVYEYKLTEVIPEGAVETEAGSNIWVYQGMYYDGRSYTVTVEVYIENGEVVVDAAYPAYPDGVNFPDTTPSRVVFVNTYDPAPTTVTFAGTKTLTGREWLDSDSFTFNLTATNEAAEALLAANTSVETTDAATKADITFEFGEFTVEQPGTYTFAIDEEGTGTVNGITYDAHVTDVKVVVVDNNGELEATVTYDNKGVSNDTKQAVFVNTYATEGTDAISLTGTKNLTGRPIAENEFFFLIDPEGTAPRYSAIPVPGDNTLEGDEEVYTSTVTLLDKVVFTKAGTYTYYIAEQVPSGGKLNGVTYDATVFKYTVTVADVDQMGKLKVTSEVLEKQDASGNWVSADAIVVNNEYVPENEVVAVPAITKELTGRDWKDGDSFNFKMEVVDASSDTGIQLPEETIITATKDNYTDLEFGDITFTEVGTYKIKITEVIPDSKISGITYSTEELYLTYKVTDNLKGELIAQLINVEGEYTFTNEYTAAGTLELTITKSLTGREWLSTDEFNFEVVVLDPDTQTAIDNGDIVFPTSGDEIQKVTIPASDDDHKVTSPEITFKKAGTYKFVVREVTGTIAGIHYDSDPRTVTVEAVDNGDGTITATPSFTIGTTAVDELNFVNVYNTESVELSGHEKLWVVKNFTGRPDDAWYDTDAFTFTLTPVKESVLTPQEGETKPAVDLDKDSEELVKELTLTITKDNKAHAHFGNIVFNKAGKYEFEIKETIPDDTKGIAYDPAVIKVTVTVADDGKGALVITSVDYTKDGASDPVSAIEFTNTYSVKEIAADIVVEKKLVGRAWKDGETFSFKLSSDDAATIAAEEDGIVTLPENAKLDIKSTGEGSDSYTGTYTIGFTEAGTYKFSIEEVKGEDDNLTYDSHEAVVTIVVTDDGAGNLVAAPQTAVEGDLTFVNTYTPDPIQVTLEGTKILTGRTLGEHEFHFRIDAVTAGAPMPAHTSVPNTLVSGSDEGKIAFGPIVYTADDAGKEYTYHITEIHSSIAGIKFDSDVKEVTVAISKDDNTGELRYEVTYPDSGKFVFRNEYTTTSTDPVKISATKVVTPSEGNSYTLEGGEFKFEITPADGNKASDPVKALASKIVTNDANGNVVFAEGLKYTEAGTYVYTIKEVQPSTGATGMTYDDNSYTLTVTVTDDQTHAKLSASVAIVDKSNKSVNSITFNNSYNPEKVTAAFSGEKHLLGGHKDLAEGEFKFALHAITPNAPMPATTVVTNDAAGTFVFDSIEYTYAGVFEYTITEVKGSETGMTYDATVYPITVTVTDVDGALQATVDGLKNADGTSKVVFSNKYVPNPAYLDISGTKTLEGRAQNAEEFEFTLLDSESNVVAKAKNTDEGKFVFKNVEFQKAGTYYYTVVEKDTDVTGVTYDLAKAYGVKVVVEDNAGQLKVADVAYTLNGEEADIVFNNSYEAVNPATIQLGAAKTLSGRELKAGEFTFLLTGSDGTEMTAVNGADGSVLFDKIEYAEAGTYTYEITESAGTDDDVTYDSSKYTVTVVVTDDLNGNYVAEITDITVTKAGQTTSVEAVTFANAYEVPDPGTSPKTNDIFNVWMLLAVIAAAGCGFFGVTAYSRRRS